MKLFYYNGKSHRIKIKEISTKMHFSIYAVYKIFINYNITKILLKYNN